MKLILRFLERESLWPLLVGLLALVILLPGLGSFGFWEPDEIRIADQASERVGLDGEPAPDSEAGDAEGSTAGSKAARELTKDDVKPPLTEWSAGLGMKYVSATEVGARLPMVLLGFLAVLCTYFLGARMASPRAGLFAALILISFPLFLFQSRQLMSEIGAVTGSALTCLGLVGLAWPTNGRAPWLYAVDAVLVAGGAVMSYFAAAALLGLVVPFGAMALACLGSLAAGVHTMPASLRRRRVPGIVWQSWPARPRLAIISVALFALALALAVYLTVTNARFGGGAHGLLLGLVLAAVVALAVSVLPRRTCTEIPPDVRRKRRHLLAVGLFAGTMALAALAVVLAQAFDLREPIPGERELFGMSLVPTEEPSRALGGVWALRDELDATFDSLFEQIAFGLFPWVALAPIALAFLAMGPRRGQRTFSGFVVCAWATLAWAVAAIMTRKVGPVTVPVLAPVAVGIAIWLDDLMSAREEADATAESEPTARAHFGIPLRPPLVALFAFLATLVIGKDIIGFPEKFLSATSAGATVSYPSGVTLLKIDLKVWLLLLGVLFAAALTTGILLWTRHKRYRAEAARFYVIRRHGVHIALGVAIFFALFLAQTWTPIVSRSLSSKHIFSVYHDLRSSGDELGIMGNYGSGPRYYAGGPYERLSGRNELLEFLKKPDRVFALAPAAELCAIHRSAKDLSYYVLDDQNAKFLLLSNVLKPGERDHNPLARAIVRESPSDIQIPMQVNFDNKVELIGISVPNAVGRGDVFEMTMYYKVLAPVSGNWKIFLHFDGGGLRFQGDHEPIGGRCGTSYWQAGDYIVDTFPVTAGNFTYPKTTYQIHAGFFRGSFPNWKNMKIVSANRADGSEMPIGKDDRVLIGTINVD